MRTPLGQLAEELATRLQGVSPNDLSTADLAELQNRATALAEAAVAAEREVSLVREVAIATQADLEQKLEEISLFRTIGDLSGSLLLSEDPFRPILDQVVILTHAGQASIFLLDEVGERLVFMSAAGPVQAGTNRPSFAVGEGVAGRVAQSGEAIVIEDTLASDDFKPRSDTRVSIRSLISFPLFSQDKVLGVLNLSAADPGKFSQDTVRVLHILARQLSGLIENARLLAQHRAYVTQIEESERRYRELVEEVSDGFFLMAASGRSLLINGRLASILGRSRGEVLDAPDWEAFMTPATRPRVMAALRESRHNRPGIEKSLDFDVLRPDGREVPVHIHCRTVVQDGALVWIGTLRDMTAQRALQRQLLQSEKLSSMGTLIAGTTHELNNKLAPILGYAELLQLADTPPDVRERVALIQQAAEGAKKIVDSLLGFSRDSEMVREAVRIADIVDSVLTMSSAALRRAGVQVVRHDDPELPLVHAARGQLEQVLLNMVNNAMHAMRGCESRTLEVWTTTEHDTVVIGVRDTGCGIPAEHLTRIFDPFFTTKAVDEGTGLGLSLSYGLVRAHGGDIFVESSPEHGTTFRIQLPVGVPDDVNVPLDIAAGEAQPWPGKPRLLVVDDEALVRDLLQEVFGESCGVTTADDGHAGLDALSEGHYDLLLVDVRMPRLDGMQFFERVQQDHPQLVNHIIFMTGDTYDPETQRFLSESGRPFLTKPFAIGDVVATVRRELSPAA